MAKNNITRTTYLLVFSGISLGIILVVYILLGRPVLQYAHAVRKEFNVKQVKVQEAQELVRSIPNPQAAMNSIKGKIIELDELSASKKQVPRLMQLLSQTAADRNLTVVSLRPREDYRPEAENLPRSINKIYMEIVLACNYQEMAEFINALNTLPMKLNIESMTVEKNQNAPVAGDAKAAAHPAGGAPELQVTFLLSTIFG